MTRTKNEERQAQAREIIKLIHDTPKNELVYLEIINVKPNPNQVRKEFKEGGIRELANSIKERGVIEPLIVRELKEGEKIKEGEYEIVAGERRWHAAQVAELKEIPCIIRDLNDDEVVVEGLIENLQREDLTAIEIAKGIKEVKQRCPGAPLEEIGKKLGFSKTRVIRYLNILRLPEEIFNDFGQAALNEKHGRALNMLKGNKKVQKDLFDEIINQRLTGDKAVENAREYLDHLPVKTAVTGVDKKLESIEKKFDKLKSREKAQLKSELKEIIKRAKSLFEKL
ncbi:ParB/RepB/Spo0J family partition protein [Candidatus Oleimmundimicrobium sp.]|uniref:ParB/RepB/Spo0J family partition protein n=1 Tax=Candidatus Oleimmundimicrobium sp. TaxID=3060597 RepID=UPI002723F996|nr:ParB/RepB/Spo0J family partition protein [Candidatus Oleimmundimicrobium sp.]MDO8886922.1 ParB/RepB/Spo0J family partition protein [Candidatus Oleimmundimicrobium sp.]